MAKIGLLGRARSFDNLSGRRSIPAQGLRPSPTFLRLSCPKLRKSTRPRGEASCARFVVARRGLELRQEIGELPLLAGLCLRTSA